MTEVVHGLEQVVASPSSVAIGNFDGVHRGHRALLRRAVDTAAAQGHRAVALTFDPHPVEVLRPEKAPPRLQPLDERIATLCTTGVDVVVVLPFTRSLARLAPERFVTEVLVHALGTRHVVVGTNFRFGADARGDLHTLVELGEVHGFRPEAVTLLQLQGRAISSTAVRAALRDGDLRWANEALGRPYTLTGTVVHGDGRGRTIGVPTANLHLAEDLMLPASGVYAGHASVDGEWCLAVTNVGVRPTFDGQEVRIETHLPDREVSLYDQALTVSFEHRIRAERRFDGPTELVEQINRDLEQVRAWAAVS